MGKKTILYLTFAILITFLGLLFVNECDNYDAESVHKGKECTCKGYEITLHDSTHVDGSRYSICVGIQNYPKEVSGYPKHFAGVDCSRVPSGVIIGKGGDSFGALKNLCFEERAWFENNAEYCLGLDLPESGIERCVKIIAAKVDNPEVCSILKSSEDSCLTYLENYRNGAYAIKENIETYHEFNPL
jgi:hypothetical protein